MAVDSLCLFFKYGHCKFKNTCRKEHILALCEKEYCEMSNCAMRHPRICRYYRDYGYCKFSPCSYAHKELVCKKELNEQKSEVDLLK